MKQIRKEIKNIILNDKVYNEDKVEQLIDLIKKDRTEQLALYGVVSSFLNKESESLGIEVNDLYLHLFDDKLYLEKEDKESFDFELEDVREVE